MSAGSVTAREYLSSNRLEAAGAERARNIGEIRDGSRAGLSRRHEGAEPIRSWIRHPSLPSRAWRVVDHSECFRDGPHP